MALQPKFSGLLIATSDTVVLFSEVSYLILAFQPGIRVLYFLFGRQPGLLPLLTASFNVVCQLC